jgi:hypothetical protein
VAIGPLPAVMIDAMNSIQPVAPSSHLVPASPVPRLAASALDGATYLIIPAVLLPLGLLLARNGIVLGPAGREWSWSGAGDLAGHPMGHVVGGRTERGNAGKTATTA